ncbi:MAG: ribosome-associated translation inhibitor RaiA [Candidatus Babeliales bacterium]
MKKQITFRDIAHTEGLENHVEQRLTRIETFLKHEQDPVTIDFILEPHRTHAHHSAELLITSPQYHVVVRHEGPDMYHVIDHVMHVGYDQLLKEKQRRIDDRKKGETPRKS